MALPDNYRKAVAEEKCGNCYHVEMRGDYKPYCRLWRAAVERDMTCNSWRGKLRVSRD